ncbi:DUF924 family protein [Jannaschia sp. M317]|uniref:DUF924 family protein n=1 Tax=Jannaschia sp. M317 TaxID=2867011 RepID=UPI0021A40CEC|nr:DUF924 family protein [Jannaschia sp. M317]UWQ16905.1 DUF924 domain-containing protein [Jannaschia sp. M317]
MPDFDPQEVLDLWFPDTGHERSPETHSAFWTERMQGGMDARIIEQFEPMTRAAAAGLLDHWAQTPRGRLALLIVLDQFPRSLWRDTPAAYAQDIQACRLAMEGLSNGDALTLAPWEIMFFVIAISHCEGPDHVDRMGMLDGVTETVIDRLPKSLAGVGPMISAQTARVKAIIETFGRHPHRNQILSRISSPAEEAYIAAGDFPHLPKDGPEEGA